MKKVREFHEKMKLAIDQPYSKELMDFRLKLLFEEIQELATAALDIEELNDKDGRYGLMQNLLKEMCDVVYVIKGMAVSFGMDFDEAFTLVHKSNMSKLPLIKDADGKVMKGLNYEPPILEGLVH
jgi:predicted HAD superfamily Cof-like phosphohydrolase|tara:strand:+ start:458 stop:832 length:375 start_codon:yes stop_codon:yes gene_type:complete